MTWMENVHKDNATFTAAFWVYPADFTSTTQILCGTLNSAGGGIGFRYRITTPSGRTSLQVMNSDAGAGANVKDIGGTLERPLTAGAWNFAALSINEATGANGAILYNNGDATLHTSTYTTPNSGTPRDHLADRGSRRRRRHPLRRAHRNGLPMVARLAQTELASLFTATRPRFGV